MNLILIFLPFVSFIIAGLLSFYVNNNKENSYFINFISWIISIVILALTLLLYTLLLLKCVQSQQVITITWLNWFISGNVYINLSVVYNIYTLSMLFLVILVSLLVHFYSYFYIEKNDNIARFISYLSLFTFSMVLLVSANNLMQMFIGWEAISLCSYLLILFWFKDEVKVISANKAFLINRFADIAFVLGIFFILSLFGNLNFSEFLNTVSLKTDITFSFLGYDIFVLDVICFLFLIASFAKSAQLFFHIWLPDAMEAPTPVSALLHAATMVTAGIFLTVKLAPLYEYSLFNLNVILIVSGITTLLGALIACVQVDIKKIIAYSTISQLGYMFLAIGVSFYNGAIFHLFTHAFFKALLFLSAGSVIHSMSGEQNIYKMGNLWRKIPITYLCIIIGSLSLVGIPGFSGFYSKELILNMLFFSNNVFAKFAYFCAIITIFFSAFYSFRLFFIVFHKKESYDTQSIKVHESGFGMLVVLIILSVFAIFSGKMLFSNFVGDNANIYWQNSIIYFDILSKYTLNNDIEIISLGLIFLAFVMSYLLYIKNNKFLLGCFNLIKVLYYIVLNEFFLNIIYNKIIVNFGIKVSKFLIKADDNIVDNYLVNMFAGIIFKISKIFNKFQVGYISIYATIMLLGFFAIITYFIFTLGI